LWRWRWALRGIVIQWTWQMFQHFSFFVKKVLALVWVNC
jgi:hypothetical protein